MAIPSLVQECFFKWFSFPGKEVHGQVCTQSNNQPHVRTMLLYHITSQGNLIFLTRTDTQKWHDLEQCPKAAVCFLHLNFGQIIAEGDVTLKTKKKEISQYWQKIPLVFQKIYLPQEHWMDPNTPIPDVFGVISITPKRWEVLQIYFEDYLQSSRKEFELKGSSWDLKELKPV